MEKVAAKITYLYNSGFALELSNHFLVFDYFIDSTNIVTPASIAAHPNPLVLVSHGHQDHYNPTILEWQQYNSSLRYIFSSDIAAEGPSIHSMSPQETLNLGDVFVRAYGSTDLGVSFLVRAEGLSIFHAGDLNWWHWREESTDSEIDNTERAFLREVEPLRGEHIDIAFFPVDPRLGQDYDAGARKFIELIKPGLLIPMHFGDNFAATRAFAATASTLQTDICAITHRGQSLMYRKKED
ncbi:MAG: hypothetical protein DDT36_00261 [Firmicutes bacterium]|nr:hypothetical protein [Bacillota bacterium]